jgi:hypothetical protein
MHSQNNNNNNNNNNNIHRGLHLIGPRNPRCISGPSKNKRTKKENNFYRILTMEESNHN